jgi:hypothetical protein
MSWQFIGALMPSPPAGPSAAAPSGSNKGPQQHRPQPFLRRNRGPTDRRIQNRKIARQTRQGLIHDGADRPKRMVLAHAIFKIDLTEQRPRPRVPACPRAPPNSRRELNHNPIHAASDFLNSPLGDQLRIARWVRRALGIDDEDTRLRSEKQCLSGFLVGERSY